MQSAEKTVEYIYDGYSDFDFAPMEIQSRQTVELKSAFHFFIVEQIAPERWNYRGRVVDLFPGCHFPEHFEGSLEKILPDPSQFIAEGPVIIEVDRGVAVEIKPAFHQPAEFGVVEKERHRVNCNIVERFPPLRR